MLATTRKAPEEEDHLELTRSKESEEIKDYKEII